MLKVSLELSREGTIQKVIGCEPGHGVVQPNMALAHLFLPGDQGQVTSLLTECRQNSLTWRYGLGFTGSDGTIRVNLCAVALEATLMVLVLEGNTNTQASIEEYHLALTHFMERVSRQAQEAYKNRMDKTARGEIETLQALNNDLNNSQRQLAKANVRLKVLNQDLSDQQEKYRQLINEVEEAQKIIKSSEEKYKTLFFNSPEGYLIISDGKFIECNRASEQLIGGTRSQIIGLSPATISPRYQPNGKKSASYAKALLKQAFEKGKISFEWLHKRFDGSEFLARVNLAVIQYEGQDVLFTSWQDITSQRAAEERVRVLSRAVEQSPVSVIITDLEGKIQYANPKACKITGYSLDELVNQKPSVLKSGTTTDAEYAALWEQITQGNEWRGVFQNLRKNGESYWESATISPVVDGQGVVNHYLAIKEDITEKRKAEEDLRMFRTISEQANYGTAVAGLDGSLLYVNDAFSQMHGWEREELIGRPLSMLHNESQMTTVVSLLDKIKTQGGFVAEEVWRTRKDGTTYPSLMSAKVIFDSNQTAQFMSATVIDISDMKEKDQELKKLTLAIEQSPVAIVITDLEANIEYVSPAFEIITGYAAQEVIGKNTKVLQSGKTKKETYQSLWNTIGGGSTWSGEWMNKRKSGELYWESISVTPIYDDNDQIIKYLAVKEDITKRKTATDLLQASNHRAYKQRIALSELTVDETIIAGSVTKALEKLVVTAAHALKVDQASVWVFSDDGDQLTCMASGGPAAFRHEAGKVLRRSDFPRYFEALQQEKRIQAEDAYEDHRTRELKEEYLKPQGIASMLDAGIVLEGHLRGVVCFEHAGTKRKWFSDEDIFAGTIAAMAAILFANDQRDQAEKAMRQSEKQFRTLFMQSPISMTILDKDTGKIIEANPAALSIRGLTTWEEMEAFSIGHEAPYTMEKAMEWIEKAVKEGPQQFEWKSEKKNGEPLWLNISLATLEMEGVTRLVSSSVDVTDQKRAEAERIAREAAEEANRAKSAFLSNMSHEIRTPMNAIIGFAQILKRDAALNPKQKEQVSTVLRSGEHLLKLINDILDLSKIEAGYLKINRADFSLNKMLEDIKAMLFLRTQEKGIELLFEIDPSVPHYVTTDEGKLRQVLINLLGNAVKFTAEGSISLRVWAEPMDQLEQDHHKVGKGKLKLMVEVVDSGIGIDEKDLDHIFDSFRQTESSKMIGGTGLGLAISKNLVEMMGGQISVESQLGIGSTFRFYVLVDIAEDIEESASKVLENVVAIEPDAGSFRVLVVDDLQDNRDMLRELLEPVGFQIKEATNGQEAVTLFEQWEPDGVLMDMRMPIMDGYEATRRIKAAARGKQTLVVAVTASAFDTDLKEIMEAGVDVYLSKPFRASELFAILSDLPGLRYVYEESDQKHTGGSPVMSLTPESMAALPNSLRLDMKAAVESGDMAKMKALIQQVEQYNVHVSQGLLVLAKNYDYEQLSVLLSVSEGDRTHGS